MRAIDASQVDLRRGKRQTARGRGLHTIELGRERVDPLLPGAARRGRTDRGGGPYHRGVGGRGEVHEVGELVRDTLASVSEKGLDSLGGYTGHPGEMSLPRAQEVAAATNRASAAPPQDVEDILLWLVSLATERGGDQGTSGRGSRRVTRRRPPGSGRRP